MFTEYNKRYVVRDASMINSYPEVTRWNRDKTKFICHELGEEADSISHDEAIQLINTEDWVVDIDPSTMNTNIIASFFQTS